MAACRQGQSARGATWELFCEFLSKAEFKWTVKRFKKCETFKILQVSAELKPQRPTPSAEKDVSMAGSSSSSRIVVCAGCSRSLHYSYLLF